MRGEIFSHPFYIYFKRGFMKALVLSGGGIGGSYQAGALKYLIEEKNLSFDIICGSSVGAINGSFLAQYKKEDEKQAISDLIDFWLKLKQKNVYKNWFPFGRFQIWKQGLYNTKPLEDLIGKVINKDKLKASGRRLSIGTVSVSTGEYKTYNEYSKSILRAIVASSSFPLFFPPYKVEDDYEFDAGIREYIPLKQAIDLGATEIYIISTDTNKLNYNNPEKLNILEITKRFILTMSDEVITNDLKVLNDINIKVARGYVCNKRVIKCHLLKPDKQLTDDTLKFDKLTIMKLIKQGYVEAFTKFEYEINV